LPGEHRAEKLGAASELRPVRLDVVDLGTRDYALALEYQKKTVELRMLGVCPDTLILVEHPSVLTLGRQATEANLLVDQAYLATQGIGLYRVERGGEVTYHGPGQIVGYPIISLKERGVSPGAYLRMLEDALIAAIDAFGLQAGRMDGFTGAWVGSEKVAAIGIAVRRGVTYHGFAFNVEPNLAHFDLIVPCGIQGKGVTSLSKLLGRSVPMAEAQRVIVREFKRVFGYL
jgi:lipoate-protein ligase B